MPVVPPTGPENHPRSAASRAAEPALYGNRHQVLVPTRDRSGLDTAPPACRTVQPLREEHDSAASPRRYLRELSSSTRPRAQSAQASPSKPAPQSNDALPARTADSPIFPRVGRGRPTARSLHPPTPPSAFPPNPALKQASPYMMR